MLAVAAGVGSWALFVVGVLLGARSAPSRTREDESHPGDASGQHHGRRTNDRDEKHLLHRSHSGPRFAKRRARRGRRTEG